MAGAWFDTKANKVVDARPEEGVQLISPDVEPTPAEVEWVAGIAAACDAAEAPPEPPAVKRAK